MHIFPIVLYITLLCNVVIIDGGIIILKRHGPRQSTRRRYFIPDAMGRPQTTKTPPTASPPRLPTVFRLNNYVPLYYKTKWDQHQRPPHYYDFTFAVYNHSHRVQIYEEIDGRMAEGWRHTIVENGADCNWKDLPTSQWENTVDWLSRELHHFAGTVVSTPMINSSSDENNTISSIVRPIRAFGFFSSGVFEGEMIVPRDCENSEDYTMWFFALAPHELKEWTEITSIFYRPEDIGFAFDTVTPDEAGR